MRKPKPKPSAPPQIIYRNCDELIPYARNARTHSEEQLTQIMASIMEFGFVGAILADEKGIVAGHGRNIAAQRLYAAGKTLKHVNGFPLPKGQVPVMDCTGWTEAQRRAYIIADNKLAENAGWDSELLSVEIGELNELGFDLSLTGFSIGEIENILSDGDLKPGLTDEDETPPAPEVSVVERGDVWLLGDHRLICGDATSADDTQKLFGKVQPSLMVTDPPYGVDYDPEWRDEQLGGIEGGRATGKVKNDDQADWSEAWSLFPGKIAYVWHAMLQSDIVLGSLRKAGFEPRAEIIWPKSQLVISRGHYHAQHESCWYVVRKGETANWVGDRKQTTRWDIDKPSKSDTGHSTQKPVECMRRGIENNSSPGHAVYDPFVGSGTTIIACEQTGRQCFAVEINPVYVEVAILRWQAFTGRIATLENTGETFTEIVGKRAPNKVLRPVRGDTDKPKAKPKKATKGKKK